MRFERNLHLSALTFFAVSPFLSSCKILMPREKSKTESASKKASIRSSELQFIQETENSKKVVGFLIPIEKLNCGVLKNCLDSKGLEQLSIDDSEGLKSFLGRFYKASLFTELVSEGSFSAETAKLRMQEAQSSDSMPLLQISQLQKAVCPVGFLFWGTKTQRIEIVEGDPGQCSQLPEAETTGSKKYLEIAEISASLDQSSTTSTGGAALSLVNPLTVLPKMQLFMTTHLAAAGAGAAASAAIILSIMHGAVGDAATQFINDAGKIAGHVGKVENVVESKSTAFSERFVASSLDHLEVTLGDKAFVTITDRSNTTLMRGKIVARMNANSSPSGKIFFGVNLDGISALNNAAHDKNAASKTSQYIVQSPEGKFQVIVDGDSVGAGTLNLEVTSSFVSPKAAQVEGNRVPMNPFDKNPQIPLDFANKTMMDSLLTLALKIPNQTSSPEQIAILYRSAGAQLVAKGTPHFNWVMMHPEFRPYELRIEQIKSLVASSLSTATGDNSFELGFNAVVEKYSTLPKSVVNYEAELNEIEVYFRNAASAESKAEIPNLVQGARRDAAAMQKQLTIVTVNGRQAFELPEFPIAAQ